MKERRGGGQEEEMRGVNEQEEEHGEGILSVSSGCPSLPVFILFNFCLCILRFCSYRP